MLELIFQGFMEWAYGLTLECWEYFSSSLLDIMSMDYAYMKSHVPVMVSITQVLLAVGWALLIGNLVFQALKSMAVGLGFEGEDPKLLFTRTFVFAFLLMASPQICEVGLSLTARIIELLEIPDAIKVLIVLANLEQADLIVRFPNTGALIAIFEKNCSPTELFLNALQPNTIAATTMINMYHL